MCHYLTVAEWETLREEQLEDAPDEPAERERAPMLADD